MASKKGTGGDGKQSNSIMRRGDSWYVRIVRDGRQVWRSAGKSKEAAQELLVKLRAELDREAAGLPAKVKASPTLSDFAPEYLAWAKLHKRSAARDVRELPRLEAHFGNLRLTEINKLRVGAFMRSRSEVVGPARINRQVALLRKILSLAVEYGKLDANPLSRIKMLREPPARQPQVSLEDEKAIVAACPPWLAWIVRLAIYTGCRQGELLSLRWRNVDFGNASLVIEDSKSGESRRVYLSQGLLAELRERKGEPDAPVCTHAVGSVPTQGMVSNGFLTVVRGLGRNDLRFHDTRHVAASRLLDAGASLPDVATVLGHKTLIIARRYAHTSPDRLRGLMDRMPGATPPPAPPVPAEAEEAAPEKPVNGNVVAFPKRSLN